MAAVISLWGRTFLSASEKAVTFRPPAIGPFRFYLNSLLRSYYSQTKHSWDSAISGQGRAPNGQSYPPDLTIGKQRLD